MIDVERLSVRYEAEPVLFDLTVRFPEGGWVALVGPNGAGKSTLLRVLAGLVTPVAGDVRLSGRDLRTLSRRANAQLVAYVAQRPVLPDAMTVADYVLLGRTPYIPYLGAESRSDRVIVSEVLERLELQRFSGRFVALLSGGEAQRAVLARALAQAAPVLLLDEPTSALDLGHAQRVLELIDQLRAERGFTVVTAMHDLTLAAQFADSLVLLSGGRLAAEGPPVAVLTEAAIKEHYGAAARVTTDPDGHVVVMPVRSS